MKLMNRIAELRKLKNVSQKDIADAVGVSVFAVSKWETGKTLPTGDNLRKMAEYLGCEPEEILSGLKKKEPMSSAVPMDDDEILLYDLLHRLPEEKRKKAVAIMQRTAELLL